MIRNRSRLSHQNSSLLIPSSNKLLSFGKVIITLLLLITLVKYFQQQKNLPSENKKISQGEIVFYDTNKDRSYIRYKVAGIGKEYWYGSIAKRFQANDWKEIAKKTIENSNLKASPQNIEEAQYKIESGMEVKIPFDAIKTE